MLKRISERDDLRQMIDFASTFAEKAISKYGELRPIYHVITGDGKNLVVPMPSSDKDVAIKMMKELFEITKAIRYIFVDEAWVLTAKLGEIDEERTMRDGIRNNPNREEAVIFMAEDRDRMMTARRMITRSSGNPDLGPLIFDDDMTESMGRMVGLLRPEGAMQ